MPTSPESEHQSPDAQQATQSSPESSPTPEAPEGAEITALRDELAHTQDRHRRALADLDNYRKRVQRDGDARATQARQALLLDWLEAVDSLELALRMQPEDPGLLAVLTQMDAILNRNGVTRLQPVGQRFDPTQYEAIAVVPATGDVADQTVLDVSRSGYAIGDEILRPAQVVVAKRPAGGQ